MTYLKAHKLFNILLVAAVVLCLLTYGAESWVITALCVLCCVAALVVYVGFYRCPHCRRHLGRVELPDFCPRCGKPLGAEPPVD